MPRTPHQKEIDKNRKQRKVEDTGIKDGKVAKRKPKPTIQTLVDKEARKERLAISRKSLVIAAQSKPSVLQKLPLQRLLKACLGNWTTDKVRIREESIELIRQYTEFMLNQLLRDAQDIMLRNTARNKTNKKTNKLERIHGVRVGLKHVDQALNTKFYADVTKVAYASFS